MRPRHSLPDNAAVLVSRVEAAARYDGHAPGACLSGVGTSNGHGYRILPARFGGRKSNVYVHILMYLCRVGSVPSGLEVRHMCHNRECCNWMHLRLGTRKENVADSVRAGRHNHGETHSHAKLTELDVTEVRSLRDRGLLQREIAGRFGITQSAVSMILRGRNWKHMPHREGNA